MAIVGIKETVKQIFTNFLEKKGLRKTPERYAIIDEIYSREIPCNIETLFELMQEKKYRVSKATLYNTIDLLLECNLINRQRTGKMNAQFEKLHSLLQNDHLICNTCGKILDYSDPRMEDIRKTAGELLDFKITSYTLNFYGECADCQSKIQKG